MNCRVSMIALILVVVSFVCNNEASSVVVNDDDNQAQNENVHASSQKPRTSLRDLFSNGKNGEQGSSSLEERSCTIEQVEITKIPGRCIRLLGGRKACVGGDFMDPVAESCNED